MSDPAIHWYATHQRKGWVWCLCPRLAGQTATLAHVNPYCEIHGDPQAPLLTVEAPR